MKSNLPLSENSYTLVWCWIQENGTNKFRKTGGNMPAFIQYSISRCEYLNLSNIFPDIKLYL